MGAPVMGTQDEGERQQILQMEQEEKEMQAKVDQALDGILHQVGNLREKAYTIQGQLKESEKQLDEADKKLDVCHDGVKGLRDKTGKMIEEQKCNSWYTYLACFLLILALFGVVVMQMGLVPKTN